MQWLEAPNQIHVDITTLWDMKLAEISEKKRKYLIANINEL